MKLFFFGLAISHCFFFFNVYCGFDLNSLTTECWSPIHWWPSPPSPLYTLETAFLVVCTPTLLLNLFHDVSLSLRIQKGLLTPLHPKGGNLFSTLQGRSIHSSEWFPSEVTSIDNNLGPNTFHLMLQSAGLETLDLARENGMFQGLGYLFS